MTNEVIAAPVAGMICVFSVDSGCYAIDAALVGEVATIDEPTPLPRCHPAVLGLANLRGQALAIVDLAQVLGIDALTPQAPGAGSRVLVLRLPGRSAGTVVSRVEGVFPRDPASFRSANRNAEATWVAGFHLVPRRTEHQQSELVATVIDPSELAARLSALAFHRPAARGG
ncbi:MAG TPA: chemotaxis protein CheW [Planctomycetota bacterium]|jgi:chemotaxis signal transduction protein|nr:chemotaxis protein CheW [Planctomycetota bacterium]